MRVGYALFGLGFILLSRADSLLTFYTFFLLAAVGGSLSGFLSISTTAVNWFYRRRGLALGIVMAGTSLGGVLMPTLTWSISSFGWRSTFVGIGVFLWLVGIPISSVMRQRPEQYGLTPDGDTTAQREAWLMREARAGRPAGERSLTLREAVSSQAFWFMGTAHGLSVMVFSALAVHQIPALVDIGASQTAAATVLSVTTAIMAVGRLAGGFMGDRMGRKQALVVCYLMQSAGLALLAVVQSLWQAYISAVLVGLGFGARGPLLVALRGDYFGRTAFATISGTMELLITSGSIVAPLFAGYLYDIRGSYSLAFLSIAGASLLGSLLVVAMRPPRGRKEQAHPRTAGVP
jgi:MFS family permease